MFFVAFVITILNLVTGLLHGCMFVRKVGTWQQAHKGKRVIILRELQGSNRLILQPCDPKVQAERKKDCVMLAEERMGKESVSRSGGGGDGAMGANAQHADAGEARRNGGGGDDVNDEVDRGRRRGLRSKRVGRRRVRGPGAGRVCGNGVAGVGGVSITQVRTSLSRGGGRHWRSLSDGFPHEDDAFHTIMQWLYSKMNGIRAPRHLEK